MIKPRSFIFFAAALAVATFSSACGRTLGEIDLVEDFGVELAPGSTAAVKATADSLIKTEIAKGNLGPVPSSTPTITPTATITPTPTNTPNPVFNMDDPAGDTTLGQGGEAAADNVIDIRTVRVFFPGSQGYDRGGWLLQVQLGAPADPDFLDYFSGTIIVRVAIAGESKHLCYILTIKDGIITKGQLVDCDSNEIVPGTEPLVFADDQGIWFFVPENATQFNITIVGLPTGDLAEDQTRFDEKRWFPFVPETE
ncbi:MAG: hypothetical protein IIC79_04875 [Chloroflexi bacterium]|nr:hypothetical protein [Chloroflexota bacterium]